MNSILFFFFCFLFFSFMFDAPCKRQSTTRYTLKRYTMMMMMIVPPNIDDSLSSSDVIVREGSNVTLRCRAMGSPTPTVKWKRDSQEKIAINKSLLGKCKWLSTVNIPSGRFPWIGCQQTTTADFAYNIETT